MNYILISIIIFLVFLITFIILSIISNQNSGKSLIKSSCLSNADCTINQQCVFDPETKKNKCILNGQKFCSLTPISDLIPCSKDADCAECLNNPAFSCVTVDDTNLKLYSPLGIPKGSWCLPKFDKSTTCNQYTSDYILAKDITTGNYRWVCSCKTRLFQNDNIDGGNCDSLVACNGGKLFVQYPDGTTCSKDPDCSKHQGDVCWDLNGNKITSGQGYCFTDWNDSINSDPTKGYCNCPPGQYCKKFKDQAGNVIMECVEDSCYPNGYTITDENGNISCSCNSGFVRCPEDIKDNGTDQRTGIINSCKNLPRCKPDPCNNGTGDTSHYDPTLATCVCGADYTKIDNTYSIVGANCKNLCSEDPCSTRGTCVVVNGKQQCTNCVAPYVQSPDNQCHQFKGLSCGSPFFPGPYGPGA